MAFRTVGKALPRIEGDGKVTGQTKYAADLPFEGLLWAKVLRSPIPHATDQKHRYVQGEGVGRRARGAHRCGCAERFRRHAASKTSRCSRATKCVLSATLSPRWRRIAKRSPRRRLTLIDVEYEELPSVYDPIEALKPSAPLIHEDRIEVSRTRRSCRKACRVIICSRYVVWKNGDIEAGFAKRRGFSSIRFARPFRITAT